MFLGEVNNQNLEMPTPTTKELPETYITNYMSLDELLTKYNACLSTAEQNHYVDKAVVKIRDAFAHGRVFSLAEEFPVTLYKFGK